MSYHVPNIPKVLNKVHFGFVKVQVSKQTETQNKMFLGFFEIHRSVKPNPKKVF